MFTYIVVQALHIINYYFCLRSFFHMVYSLNLFFVSVAKFFIKKFDYITKQIAKLERPVDNDKLHELIEEFNFVYLEVVKINDYFKVLFLANLLHFFFMAIICAFVSLFFTEIRLKLLFFALVSLLYLAIFGLPFKTANSLHDQVRSDFGGSHCKLHSVRFN